MVNNSKQNKNDDDGDETDVRTFKVVKATQTTVKGKYKVDDSVRSRYVIAKQTDGSWPSVTNAASKALTILCNKSNGDCKKTFVLRETTQGFPKKLWFYEGTTAAIPKSEIDAFIKKNPKMKERAPRRRTTSIGLVDSDKLGHSNPLAKWK